MGRRVSKTVDLRVSRRYQIELSPKSGMAIGKVHGIGSREMQQDAFGVSGTGENEIKEKGLLAVLADGMGGMSSGERASMATVVSCLDFFGKYGIGRYAQEELTEMMHEANADVVRELGGVAGGSTAIVAYIREKKVSWASVGDSHIYLYRKHTLYQLNHDHNYAATLQIMVEEGRISREEALQDPQRAALTSFMGLEELPQIDSNEEPLDLKKGDRLVLMSDGVFGTLSNEEMESVMEYLPEKTAMLLEAQIQQKRRRNQDNYAAIIIEIL